MLEISPPRCCCWWLARASLQFHISHVCPGFPPPALSPPCPCRSASRSGSTPRCPPASPPLSSTRQRRLAGWACCPWATSSSPSQTCATPSRQTWASRTSARVRGGGAGGVGVGCRAVGAVGGGGGHKQLLVEQGRGGAGRSCRESGSLAVCVLPLAPAPLWCALAWLCPLPSPSPPPPAAPAVPCRHDARGGPAHPQPLPLHPALGERVHRQPARVGRVRAQARRGAGAGEAAGCGLWLWR